MKVFGPPDRRISLPPRGWFRIRALPAAGPAAAPKRWAGLLRLGCGCELRMRLGWRAALQWGEGQRRWVACGAG